jgi:pyruvate formate lyase activating enzyme
METSGACPWSRLNRLLKHCDLVLYDLKLIDDADHRRWTGASNRQTLHNAARLRGRVPASPMRAPASRRTRRGPSHHDVQVRVPLIPNITDTDGNVRAIFAFMADVGLRSVAFLPYNPATAAKYEWFDLPCEVQGEVESASRLTELVALAKHAGLEAAVV